MNRILYKQADEATIEESIISYIAQELLQDDRCNSVTRDFPLLEDAFLDSYGLQELLTFIETHYDISIDDEDLVPENFINVGAIAQLVERMVAD